LYKENKILPNSQEKEPAKAFTHR